MRLERMIDRLAALAAGLAVLFFLGRYASSVAIGRIRLSGEDFVSEAWPAPKGGA